MLGGYLALAIDDLAVAVPKGRALEDWGELALLEFDLLRLPLYQVSPSNEHANGISTDCEGGHSELDAAP